MPIDFDASTFEKGIKDMLARVKAREKKAVIAGARVLRDEVEARAPVDTGNLKNNIVITEPKQGADEAVFAYVGPKDVGGMTYSQRIGLGGDYGKSAPFYGRFVEFGTSRMRARPFVEPAFLAKKDEVLQAMAEVVKEAVEGNGDV
jgi:HK97 gp10 family phage protein